MKFFVMMCHVDPEACECFFSEEVFHDPKHDNMLEGFKFTLGDTGISSDLGLLVCPAEIVKDLPSETEQLRACVQWVDKYEGRD